MLSAISAWLDKAEAQMGKEGAQALLTARLAADILPYLGQRRLPHVDQGIPAQVFSLDFAHLTPPSGCSRSAP